jgi:hypothetical protein
MNNKFKILLVIIMMIMKIFLLMYSMIFIIHIY